MLGFTFEYNFAFAVFDLVVADRSIDFALAREGGVCESHLEWLYALSHSSKSHSCRVLVIDRIACVILKCSNTEFLDLFHGVISSDLKQYLDGASIDGLLDSCHECVAAAVSACSVLRPVLTVDLCTFIGDRRVYCDVVSPAFDALAVDTIVDESPFLAGLLEFVTLLESCSVYSERLNRRSRLSWVETTVKELLTSELTATDHRLDLAGTNADYSHGCLRLARLGRKSVCLLCNDDVITIDLYESLIIWIGEKV